MRALRALSLANLKSFTRDRAALFWTLAFPIVFVILFGTIFSGGGGRYAVGWVDQDGSPAAAALRAAFAANAPVELTDGTFEESKARMLSGDVDGILVIPKGLSAVIDAAKAGQHPDPIEVEVVTDPSRSNTALAIQQIATGLVMAANVQLSGATPLLSVMSSPLQTQQLNGVSFFVPSILAMALMQLGVFASIPLVQQREKLILKRLNATPLPRWALVGSNVAVRLVIAAVQTALILGIGIALLGVKVVGDPLPDVHLDRLCDRLVRTHGGGRERHHQRGPVPADVPLGHLLPARGAARLAPQRGDAHAPDLPRRCAPPDDGRRGAVHAAPR